MTNASSVPMLTSSPRMPIGVKPAASATTTPVTIVVMCGVRNLGWIFCAQRRQQAVVRHRVEDARLRRAS